MKPIQKLKRCEHRSRRNTSNLTIYMAAIVVLLCGAAAEAATSRGSLSVQTSGLQINFQFAAPEGPRLLIQRVKRSRG